MRSSSTTTEKELIRAARDNRDREVWTGLKRRYWRRLRSRVAGRFENDHVLRRLHDDGYMADAITRLTFRKAWKKNNLDRFSYPYSFLGWLHRIAMNLCTDERRRQERIREKIEKAIRKKELDVPPHTVSAEEAAEIQERERRLDERRNAINNAIHECLAVIPDERKEVIVLHRFEKLKYRQIADRLGIPLGTVKSRMSRGSQVLRQCLRSRFPQLYGQ